MLKGMEAGVAALIVDLIIDMVRMVMQEKSLLLTAMIPAAFISSFFLNINVAVYSDFLLCHLHRNCMAQKPQKQQTGKRHRGLIWEDEMNTILELLTDFFR